MKNYATLGLGLSLSLMFACSSTHEGGGAAPPWGTTPMDAKPAAMKPTAMKPSMAAPAKKVKPPAQKKVSRKAPTNFLVNKLRIYKKVPRRHLRNRVFLSARMLVYFPTNNWTLYRNDLNDIASYAKAFKRTQKCQTFVIEGHADFRGSDDDNRILGLKRANGVKKVFVRNFRGCMKVKVATYGESKPEYKGKNLFGLRKNRRVVVIPHTNVIHMGLQRCPGDAYLLDHSGSMGNHVAGKSKWQHVLSYPHYKSGASFFVFDDSVKKTTRQGLRGFGPAGGTALFESVLHVLRTMTSGQTLTVLSDGLSGTRPSTMNQLLALAKSRNITINVVGIGFAPNPQITKMVSATSGKLYLASR